MPPLIERYRASYVRPLLIDLALASVIITCIVFVRVLLSVGHEVHQFRLDFDEQAVSLRTSVESTGKDLSSSAYSLNVNTQSIIDRLDSQLTDIRVLVKKASKENQKATEKAIQNSSNTIRETLTGTNDALQSVADKADDVAVAKPIIVQAPAAKTVVEKQPVIIQAPPAPPAKKQEEKRRGAWSRFWHWAFRMKE